MLRFVALELVLECVALSVSLLRSRLFPKYTSPFRREKSFRCSERHAACSEFGKQSLPQPPTLPLMLLKAWKSTPSGVALQLVRSILNESASPLTTKQIYEEAVRREAGTEYPHPPALVPGASAEQPKELKNKRGVVHRAPPPPPHPDYAIRSIRCVLETAYT
jgi:hypothetical protein